MKENITILDSWYRPPDQVSEIFFWHGPMVIVLEYLEAWAIFDGQLSFIKGVGYLEF